MKKLLVLSLSLTLIISNVQAHNQAEAASPFHTSIVAGLQVANASFSTGCTASLGTKILLNGLDAKFLEEALYFNMKACKANYDICAAALKDSCSIGEHEEITLKNINFYMKLITIVQEALTNMLKNSNNALKAASYGILEQSIKEAGYSLVNRFNTADNRLQRKLIRITANTLIDSLTKNIVAHFENDKKATLTHLRATLLKKAIKYTCYEFVGELILRLNLHESPFC